MTITSVQSKIGKQDINYLDGTGTDTFTRLTSSGGSVTLNKVGNIVDVSAVYGSGTTKNSTVLNAALINIGASVFGVELAPGNWALTADVTIPTTVTYMPAPGAYATVATTKTLTINGPIQATPYQRLFAWGGTGVVSLGAIPSLEVYANWFNLVGDDSTDNAAALQMAIDAI